MNYTEHFTVLDTSYTTVEGYTVYVNSTEDRSSFTLPIWRQVLWSLGYSIMVVVATGGNLIVIWIVLAHKRMRTVTNYFLVNLSIADTMVSTLNVIFNFVYMLYVHWPFGEIYCKITQFVAVLSICASVFSLMIISIDRYMAIMTPLKPRMGRTCTIVFIALTWIFGFIIGFPYLLYFKTSTISDVGERTVCFSEWPDGISNHSQQENVFNIVFFIITYIIPISSMMYTYARIGCELWGSKSIGECTERQLENIKSKRKIVKMMMVVVLIFAFCWLPYHMYFFITFYFPAITDTDYIQEVYLAIYWLAMSNSMYNPIIYCWMNAKFRRGFKQVFRCFPFVKPSPSNSLSRRDGTMSRRRSFSQSSDHRRIVRNGTVVLNIFSTSRPSPSTVSTDISFPSEVIILENGTFYKRRRRSENVMKNVNME